MAQLIYPFFELRPRCQEQSTRGGVQPSSKKAESAKVSPETALLMQDENSVSAQKQWYGSAHGVTASQEEYDDLTDSCGSCFWSFSKTAIEILEQLRQQLRWILKKWRNGSSQRNAKSEKIFQLKETLSKTSDEELLAESESALLCSEERAAFTAINFYIRDKEWQCTGFDLESNMWTRLATLSWLPTPDADLFKEYSVCGSETLMCANVSKVAHKEELMVFNLMTGETRLLPPLHYARNPVLLHISVDSATNSYKVIAAGSSASSGEVNLSRRVEMFHSQTLKWEVVKDFVPGPEFGLNEHQTGVCVDGVLYFLAFLDHGEKGVIAFDVEKRKWLEDKTCSIPFASNLLQLVESGGNVYLFSEQEHDGVVEHCIDVIDDVGALKNVVRVKKSGGRGLLVYPEYICVPYGNAKLCVFNTIKRDGLVYDIQSGTQCGVLEEPPANQRGDNFFSLNPVSFTLQPNFISKP